ncbi:MAG: dephospho-CoA kinase, partial [Planctomycetota bacterium]
RRLEQRLQQLREDPRVRAIVLDAPKLVEAGLDRLCDRIVYVETDARRRSERTARSRGWTEEEWKRREKNLGSLDKKRALADDVLENNSDIEALRTQVKTVFASLLASFA